MKTHHEKRLYDNLIITLTEADAEVWPRNSPGLKRTFVSDWASGAFKKAQAASVEFINEVTVS